MPRICVPYSCPRCGYSCEKKTDIYNHLYVRKKVCPALQNDVELTDQVKQYILDNKIYKVETLKNSVALTKKIDSLQMQLDIALNKKSEKVYQKLLEKHLGGTHKTLDCGITDITTDDFHAEIKHWPDWKAGVGQLKVYNASDPRPSLRLYLFGKAVNNKRDVGYILDNDIDVFEVDINDNKELVIRDCMFNDICHKEPIDI